MKMSVITPSFRSSEWLKLCIASVADQEGVEFEHIVQDAGSDDGTLDWLPSDKRVRAVVEKDSGMYDAVNRGFRKASGEILSYINSDEQYLPGALKAVQDAFDARPDLDVLAAHAIVVDQNGEYICNRKAMVPWAILAWTFLPMTTAGLFVRRRVLTDCNLYFDTRWRGIGDVMWMRDALQMRLKFGVLKRFTSTFTETGDNLSLHPSFNQERRTALRLRPRWMGWMRWPLRQLHRTRALANGLYSRESVAYSIYTKSSPSRRKQFSVVKGTGIWWQRHAHVKV